MAFYIKPTNLQKGQDNIASLDKSQLLLESKVSNDSYYSDSSNWNYVVVTYKSVGGNQLSNVIFDASLENPTASFFITEKARDVWQVKSVRIDDFDGGYLSFDRNELTVSDFDLSFLPAEPTQLVITQQFTSSLAGDVISPSLTVELRDIDNNLVTTATNEVTLSLETDPSSNTASVSGTLVKNAVNGVVVFDDISIDKAFDGYVFRVDSTALTGAIATSIDISANVASQLNYVVQPPSALNEELVISPSIQVEIVDSFGNRTADTSEITLSINNDPSGQGVLYGTLVKNAVNGLVIFEDIIIDIEGSGATVSGFNLNATSTGLTNAVSSSFDVYRLSLILSNPTTATAGEIITPPITAQVFNSNLENVTDSSTTVLLQIEASSDPSGGSATLSGTTTKNAVSGLATFDNLSIDQAFYGYKIQAFRLTPNGFVLSALSSSINVESAIVPLVDFTRDFSNPNSLQSNETLNIAQGTAGSLSYGINQIEYSLIGDNGFNSIVQYSREFTDDNLTLEESVTYNLEIDINSISLINSDANDKIVIVTSGPGGNIIDVPYSSLSNGTNFINGLVAGAIGIPSENAIILQFSPQSSQIGKDISFNISRIRITKVV